MHRQLLHVASARQILAEPSVVIVAQRLLLTNRRLLQPNSFLFSQKPYTSTLSASRAMQQTEQRGKVEPKFALLADRPTTHAFKFFHQHILLVQMHHRWRFVAI